VTGSMTSKASNEYHKRRLVINSTSVSKILGFLLNRTVGKLEGANRVTPFHEPVKTV
jgi:hypothetical protein